MARSADTKHRVSVMKTKTSIARSPAASFRTDQERWRAVMDRNPLADSRFFYGVHSTGVYCRPSCPSRRPRREGVRFFDSTDSAEKAGFRACLRCKPRQASVHGDLIARLCRFIEQHSDEALSLARLSAEARLSPFHLQRVFKTALGVSPREYADACRFRGFKTQLAGAKSVTDALFAAGYGSSSRLYQSIGSKLGMTPRRYLAGGRGARIRYAVSDSPLGRVLVASTERGVCAISLGENDASLVAALRHEFPSADIQPAARASQLPLDAVCDYLNGARASLNLPLDIQATAFQRRVWRALQSIPPGETRTYTQVARAIRRPTAVRAVASACAANHIALAIPCHRVIRSDGAPGGYRWGLKRKQRLLALERGGAWKR